MPVVPEISHLLVGVAVQQLVVVYALGQSDRVSFDRHLDYQENQQQEWKYFLQ